MKDEYDTLTRVKINGDDREWRLVDLVHKASGTFLSLVSYMYPRDKDRSANINESVWLVHKLVPVRSITITQVGYAC